MKFEVIEQENGKYVILDTGANKLCSYSGKATNPPAYKGESKCKCYEWNNYHSAFGFAQRLESASTKY